MVLSRLGGPWMGMFDSWLLSITQSRSPSESRPELAQAFAFFLVVNLHRWEREPRGLQSGRDDSRGRPAGISATPSTVDGSSRSAVLQIGTAQIEVEIDVRPSSQGGLRGLHDRDESERVFGLSLGGATVEAGWV